VEAPSPPNAQGEITGDLVLVGRGDPNLSPRVMPYQTRSEFSGSPTVALDRLADQLAAAGVHAVNGDVIGDDTYFVYERYGAPGQPDLCSHSPRAVFKKGLRQTMRSRHDADQDAPSFRPSRNPPRHGGQ
jgi:D-alanyl-D-alanine carboxypeptidase